MSKPEGLEQGFLRQVIGCIASPRRTFKSIAGKPSLVKAAVIVFFIAVFAAWASYNYLGKFPLPSVTPQDRNRGFPGPGGFVNPEQIRQTLMVLGAVMKLVGVFAAWFVSSAILHGFSRVTGGKGNFKGVMALAGYASTPLLILHLLRLADSILTSEEGMLQLMGGLQLSANPFLNLTLNSVLNTFSLFRVWSMALLVIALREYYGISTSKSVLVVLLSYVLIALLSAFFPLLS